MVISTCVLLNGVACADSLCRFYYNPKIGHGNQNIFARFAQCCFYWLCCFVVSLALNPNIGNDPNIFGKTQWYSSFFVLPFVTPYECIVYKFTQRLGITISKICALRANWCHFIVWVALVMLTVLLEYSRLQLIL